MVEDFFRWGDVVIVRIDYILLVFVFCFSAVSLVYTLCRRDPLSSNVFWSLATLSNKVWKRLLWRLIKISSIENALLSVLNSHRSILKLTNQKPPERWPEILKRLEVRSKKSCTLCEFMAALKGLVS